MLIPMIARKPAVYSGNLGEAGVCATKVQYLGKVGMGIQKLLSYFTMPGCVN